MVIFMSKQSKKKYIEDKKNKHEEYVKKRKYRLQMSMIKEYNVSKEIELLELLLQEQLILD